MANRRIAIHITVENRQAVQATQAQTAATNALSHATDKHTHLQNGLTNSFIKGNLAARAISVAYITLRDSLQFAVSEAIKFEHNMTKISAITETGDASLRSLEKTIRGLSQATNQSQNEIAKTALEMGKMGLTGPQVEEALGGVARLARALDEDMVRTGETVVAVLNAYGFATSEAGKVTDQLAFTVKASALSIETFGTAFSYVGGTAKAAGVDFTELQGSMDVLSNAGIKASTIGTQLRRVIADLSNPVSKASVAIGGQTIETLGLVGALQALREKNIDIAGLTQIFGRTASSVSSILIRYADVIGDLAKKTDEANVVTKSMSDQMNTTLLSNLQGVKISWAELGIEISKSTGFLKSFVQFAREGLDGLSAMAEQTRNVEAFRKADPKGANKAINDAGYMASLFHRTDNAIAESPQFAKWLAQESQREGDRKRKENISSELMATFDQSFKLPKNFNPSKQLDLIKVAPEQTYMYGYLEKMFGTDKEGFAAAVKKAKIQWALKAERVTGEEFNNSVLDKTGKNKAFKPNSASNFLLGITANAEPLSEGNEMWETEADNRRLARIEAYSKEYEARERFLEQLRKESREYPKLDDAMRRYTEGLTMDSIAVEHLDFAMQSLGGSTQVFGDLIVDSFLGHKDAFSDFQDAFGNMAKNFVSELIAMEIRILAFKAAMRIFGLFAGGGAGTLLEGGGAPAFLAPGTGLAASGMDQIVRSPTAFVAGEAGAERVTVTPRAKMGASSGEAVVFNISGDVYDYDRFARKVKEAQGANRGNYV